MTDLLLVAVDAFVTCPAVCSIFKAFTTSPVPLVLQITSFVSDLHDFNIYVLNVLTSRFLFICGQLTWHHCICKVPSQQYLRFLFVGVIYIKGIYPRGWTFLGPLEFCLSCCPDFARIDTLYPDITLERGVSFHITQTVIDECFHGMMGPCALNNFRKSNGYFFLSVKQLFRNCISS